MPDEDLPKLTLVLGGVASGKSAFAERLAVRSGRPRRYIATAQPFDDEMREKIAAHRAQRGPDWTTVEAPLDLCGALEMATGDEAVLLDCATVWLGNMLHHGRDLEREFARLENGLAACAAPVLVVSNEVGMGGIAATQDARQFANAQGRLNQRLAARSDQVFMVIAGCPIRLKGAP